MVTQNCLMSEIEQLEGVEGGYRVASRSRAGLEHTVHVLEGTCSCEAGQRGLNCWHLDLSRALYYWERYRHSQQRWSRRYSPPATPE